MVSREFVFKINKRFDSLIWLWVVRYFYTRRGHIIGELNGDQEQACQARKKKKWNLFPLWGLQFYKLSKCFLTCLDENFEYRLIDHLNLNELIFSLFNIKL